MDPLLFLIGWLLILLYFEDLLHFPNFLGKLCYFFLISLNLFKVISFLLLHLLDGRLLLHFINWPIITHIFNDLVFLLQFLLQILDSVHICGVEFTFPTTKVFLLVTNLDFCYLLLALLQLLLYALYPLLCEESEIIRVGKLNTLFHQHLVRRKEQWWFASFLVLGQPLCQHVDTLEAEDDVSAANVLYFWFFFEIGDFVIWMLVGVHLLFLKKSMPRVMMGWVRLNRQAFLIEGYIFY
jgi:hypothetical protein